MNREAVSHNRSARRAMRARSRRHKRRLNPLAWRAMETLEDRMLFSVTVPTIGPAMDVTPPQVSQVVVSGSEWTSDFLNHVDTGRGLGYVVPTGGNQMATLPWTNLDQISIVFNEDVNVTMNDLNVTGVKVAAYNFIDFNYNAATHTATWKLQLNPQADGTKGIGADKLMLTLDDTVADSAGIRLDGEWTQGASAQSGNGVAGGDFTFRLNVLPGNVDQSDTTGSVFGNDVVLVRNMQFTYAGQAGYDAMYDVNGNGSIFGDDVVATRNRQFTDLPTANPVAPTSTSDFINNWFTQSLNDTQLQGLGVSFFDDNVLDRTEVMTMLMATTTDDGFINATELADMRAIFNSASTLGLETHVRALLGYVVNGNVANASYRGSALGNLTAGSSQAHVGKLVNKWFLGMDRPEAKSSSGSTTYQYRLANGSLFVNGAAYSDVKQGYVGDCYLLAGLGSVAYRDPSAIENMFIDNGDGTYTVRWFNNGNAQFVTVDMYLPTDSAGRFVFANLGGYASSSANELWVALAEKAYAQLNEQGWIRQDGRNSYQGIAGGWMEYVYEHVLGRNASSATISTSSSLLNMFNSGSMISIGTKTSTTNGVVANHAYILTGYDASTGKFTLYNPWGTQYTLSLTWSQIQANFDWIAAA